MNRRDGESAIVARSHLRCAEVDRLRNQSPEGLLTSKGGRVNPWLSKHLQTLIKTGSDTPTDTPSKTPPRRVRA